MIGSKIFIDSSVWLSYFFADSERAKELIESEEILFTSVISLFEIKRKLLKSKLDRNKINELIDYIKQRSVTIGLTLEICEKAAEISLTYKLSAIDSLIYTSSNINDSTLATSDYDFKEIRDVVII